MKVLLVDDEPVALESLKRLLRRYQITDCQTCTGGAEAITRLKAEHFDVVLLDLLMPEVDGLQVLEETVPVSPYTEVIVLTALDETKYAVKAIKLGAYDYLVKPVDNERIILTMERAFERKGLKAGLGVGSHSNGNLTVPEAFDEMVTQSPRMRELLVYAEVMARSGNPIVISGESGTGKELVARGIHRASSYAQGPFVPVNLASIPASLFESQFFGHVAGSFTGAKNDHRGFFEQAHGGTLFLDEVGALPPELQPKLLRVLQEKTVTRLGGSREIRVDVRIVSATNKDLDQASRDGEFRLDLLHRLKSVLITLPPLRERIVDIPWLVRHFLEEIQTQDGKISKEISSEAMRMFTHRSYPGNIRELKNIVSSAAFLAGGEVIQPRHLPQNDSAPEPFARALCSLEDNENTHVAYVINQMGGNRKEAAQVLGISVRHLQRKLASMRTQKHWREYLGDI